MNIRNYDFIDFGAGTGGSIDYCQRRFGGIGMGLELNQKKVQEARDRGFEVFESDITDLPGKKEVKFVSMMDFLEHLPDLRTVDSMIEVACNSAREFVFINHPIFDEEEYLDSLGYKLYFHDWSNHTVHPSLGFILNSLTRRGAESMDIRFRKEFSDASHDAVLPKGAPSDTHRYDQDLHGPKSDFKFDRVLYEQVHIIARLK